MKIPTGYYTVQNEDGECKTFQVKLFRRGSLRGKTCIGLCHGDRTPTYFAFADGGVKMWKQFHCKDNVRWWVGLFSKILKDELFSESGEWTQRKIVSHSKRRYQITLKKYASSI